MIFSIAKTIFTMLVVAKRYLATVALPISITFSYAKHC